MKAMKKKWQTYTDTSPPHSLPLLTCARLSSSLYRSILSRSADPAAVVVFASFVVVAGVGCVIVVGGVDEVVTTRRLVHIVKAFAIFGNRLTAVTNCISRFDEDTKQSFLDLYTKVDAGEEVEDDHGYDPDARNLDD